jgi:hypothetical protein
VLANSVPSSFTHAFRVCDAVLYSEHLWHAVRVAKRFADTNVDPVADNEPVGVGESDGDAIGLPNAVAERLANTVKLPVSVDLHDHVSERLADTDSICVSLTVPVAIHHAVSGTNTELHKLRFVKQFAVPQWYGHPEPVHYWNAVTGAVSFSEPVSDAD